MHPKIYHIETKTVSRSVSKKGSSKKRGGMGKISCKSLKTDTEKMSAFRLAKMLMKTNELRSSCQDVDENKGSCTEMLNHELSSLKMNFLVPLAVAEIESAGPGPEFGVRSPRS